MTSRERVEFSKLKGCGHSYLENFTLKQGFETHWLNWKMRFLVEGSHPEFVFWSDSRKLLLSSTPWIQAKTPEPILDLFPVRLSEGIFILDHCRLRNKLWIHCWCGRELLCFRYGSTGCLVWLIVPVTFDLSAETQTLGRACQNYCHLFWAADGAGMRCVFHHKVNFQTQIQDFGHVMRDVTRGNAKMETFTLFDSAAASVLCCLYICPIASRRRNFCRVLKGAR